MGDEFEVILFDAELAAALCTEDAAYDLEDPSTGDLPYE
jgi:hypothetical protein